MRFDEFSFEMVFEILAYLLALAKFCSLFVIY